MWIFLIVTIPLLFSLNGDARFFLITTNHTTYLVETRQEKHSGRFAPNFHKGTRRRGQQTVTDVASYEQVYLDSNERNEDKGSDKTYEDVESLFSKKDISSNVNSAKGMAMCGGKYVKTCSECEKGKCDDDCFEMDGKCSFSTDVIGCWEKEMGMLFRDKDSWTDRTTKELCICNRDQGGKVSKQCVPDVASYEQLNLDSNEPNEDINSDKTYEDVDSIFSKKDIGSKAHPEKQTPGKSQQIPGQQLPRGQPHLPLGQPIPGECEWVIIKDCNNVEQMKKDNLGIWFQKYGDLTTDIPCWKLKFASSARSTRLRRPSNAEEYISALKAYVIGEDMEKNKKIMQKYDKRNFRWEKDITTLQNLMTSVYRTYAKDPICDPIVDGQTCICRKEEGHEVTKQDSPSRNYSERVNREACNPRICRPLRVEPGIMPRNTFQKRIQNAKGDHKFIKS